MRNRVGSPASGLAPGRAAGAWLGALGIAAALTLPGVAAAQISITVGPWTFAETAFADDATQLDMGDLSSLCNTGLDDALTGFSPDTYLVNIGTETFPGNLFQLDFTDFQAVSLGGAEIVFFDARFSGAAAPVYEIAVRTAPAGAWSSFVAYEDFIGTGANSGCVTLSPSIRGAEIDLDDFGLERGTIVDALQFRGVSSDPDPIMAGVLGGCPPAEIDRTLSDDTILGTQEIAACRSVTLGPNLGVEGAGDLSVRAGVFVELVEGFSVADTAVVSIELDDTVGAL
jgi:hypothetical protein